VKQLIAGSVVKATAGRDKGGFFTVTQLQNGYCFIADGKSRKLASHKRKNLKHISPTGSVIDLNGITDKKLRTLLKCYANE
jgi:ribosomal protein L14E/L6E/L27E